LRLKWENVHDGISQTFAALKLRLDTKAKDKKKEDEAKEKAKMERDEAVKKLEDEAGELKKKIAREERHQEVGASEPVVTVVSVSTEEGVSRYLDTIPSLRGTFVSGSSLIHPDYVPRGSHILFPHLVNRKLKPKLKINQTANQYTNNGKNRRDVKSKKTPKTNATE
jgi:hypothetical protein